MHPLYLSSGSAPAPNPAGGNASRHIRALAASRGSAAMGRAKITYACATYPPSGGGLSVSGWKAGKEPRRVALTRRRVRTTAGSTGRPRIDAAPPSERRRASSSAAAQEALTRTPATTPAARVWNFSRRSSADGEAVLQRATARRGVGGPTNEGLEQRTRYFTFRPPCSC
ncbi:uncharacterized protein Tco025E_09581 [Trypanosoma conorhini]|uniref:Uncharacterized protein n=1 Tax=Trypanosoma conorhini TaxID=83891 RepID=A0A3R7KAU2_9TRYP|nr:uncharacterized protein Tco025E_09581 [Trypanosoma conorhini]RNE96975.1 hypothetical protein Tco025E_09581 [Trypanosoma conorhini]